MTPAGGTTNTLMGIANLGGKCVLCGKIGKDSHGDFYEEIITKDNIKSNLARCEKHATGRFLNFITPDAERTFAVNLGAAINLKKPEIIEEDIKQSKILYVTGYEFEAAQDTVMHALDIAKANNIKIALDLADPELVKRNLEDIKALIRITDIVFMNETEATALTGLEPEQAVSEIGQENGKDDGIVIVKIGKGGSFVHSNGTTTKIEPYLKDAVDTTGAGDLYAAGFLYGLVNEKPLELCGKYGSYMASKIVEIIGGRLENSVKEEIDVLQ